MLIMLTFTLTLIAGTLVAVTSSMWFTIWMGLELNLMSMIPILAFNSKSDTPMKYFMTQALASSMLLMGVLMSSMPSVWSYLNLSQIILLAALLMKLGAAPLHFWLLSIMDNSNCMNCLILITWQKIAPLFLILNMADKLLMGPMLLSAFIGSVGGYNQTSLRKLMAYSSIGHMGWMMAAMMTDEQIFILYFLTYILISFTIMMYLGINKIMYTPQLLTSAKNKMTDFFTIFKSNIFSSITSNISIFTKMTSNSSISKIKLYYDNNILNCGIVNHTMLLSTSVMLFIYTPTLYNSNKDNKTSIMLLTPSVLGMPFMLMLMQYFKLIKTISLQS